LNPTWCLEKLLGNTDTDYILLYLHRYSFEGVLQAIYGFDREPLVSNLKEQSMFMFHSGEDVLKELDVENAKFYIDFIVLVGFFILLRLACYLVLRWKVKVH